MLISEELLLLLSKDDGGSESMSYRGYGMAAAAIADLFVGGRIDLSDEKHPRLRVVSTEPPDHPALAPVLAGLAEKRDGKRLDAILMWGTADPTHDVARSLEDAGVLEVREKRLMGLLPERYPVRDPQPEADLRRRLAAVIAGDEQAGENDVSLLGIIQALGLSRRILREEAGDLSGADLKRRITEIAEAGPVSEALKRAIDAMTVTITAIAASAAATAATS